jgi:hypothetical protein
VGDVAETPILRKGHILKSDPPGEAIVENLITGSSHSRKSDPPGRRPQQKDRTPGGDHIQKSIPMEGPGTQAFLALEKILMYIFSFLRTRGL